VNGFQVAPAELEGCLLGHPFVDDACVVGVPHPMMGEIPLAYIVPSPSVVARVNDDELYRLVSQEITQVRFARVLLHTMLVTFSFLHLNPVRCNKDCRL
jgi:acyl-coenzyme A synthetase/AMP-(fatty) acid ligase